MNLFWIGAILCLAPPGEPVSSGDFLADLAAYDGQDLVFEGEVIQDVMIRGDHAWLNIFDGQNAIGVWTPTSLLPAELRSGDYGQHGDTLRVEGVLHTACGEHGGELDIHATLVTRLASAEAIPHPVSLGRWRAAIAALVLALTLAALGTRVERRRAMAETR